MTKNELRATYPEWTVYLFDENLQVNNMHTSEYFVQLEKDYKQCTEAINKQDTKKWIEKQDRYLFQIIRILEQEREQHKDISKSEFVDRLRDIGYDIDRLIDDME